MPDKWKCIYYFTKIIYYLFDNIGSVLDFHSRGVCITFLYLFCIKYYEEMFIDALEKDLCRLIS